MAPFNPDEPSLGDTPFGSTTPVGGSRGGLSSAVSQVTRLAGVVNKLGKQMAQAAKEAKNLATAAAGIGAVGGGSGTNPATVALGGGSNNHPTMNNNSPSTGGTRSGYMTSIINGANIAAAQTAVARGDVGAMGAGAMTGIPQVITSIVGSIFGGIGGAMESRIQRGYQYSSAADKMSVMYQQITGMSNAQVRNTYRQPLTNYRLGEGGINTMLALQASTGISARGQAQSVEALRTLSGFSLGAGDVANMLATMGTPQVANRMFMMTGQGLYKPGGGQRTGLELIQSLARSSGLTGLRDPSSALQQGSNIRMRLADYGVDQQTQDLVIQYAMANKQYQQKSPGGGMYDPGNKQHRVVAGIEENFATQMEETIRTRANREENFYGRQADNFAALEERTQSLERMFGRLEDRLSGMVGAQIKYSNERKAAGGLMKALGPAMTMLGAGLTFTGAGAAFGVPLMVGGAALTAGGNLAAPGGDGNVAQPPRSAVQETTSQLSKNESFSGMSSTMKDRVAKLIAASGGRVTFGNGFRSPQDQENMFRSRYRKTRSAVGADGRPNWFWEGSYWEHVSGPAAAPPGKSMHGVGLAADLGGDMNWLMANAGRFGLKHFGNSVSKEPWHVQPAEMPDNTTGSGMSGAEGHTSSARRSGLNGTPSQSMAGSAMGGAMGSLSVSMLNRMSMSEAISSFMSSNRSGYTGGAASPTGGAYRRTSGAGGGRASSAPGVPSGFTHGGMARSGIDIGSWAADFLNRIGAPVTLANLEVMSAWIASEGTKAAFNPLGTITSPDASGGAALGAWTPFNTFGEGGKYHVWNFANYEQGMLASVHHVTNYQKRIVNALRSHSDNPYEVAKAIEQTHSGWADNYQTTSVLRGRHVTEHSGDPQMASRMSMGSGGNTSIVGGTTINISPTINLMSTGNSSVDAQQLYREVMALFEQNARYKLVRSS